MTTPLSNSSKRARHDTIETRPCKKAKTMESLEGDAGFMDKYSRQIGAFGLETMAKLVKLKVLIVGMRGVGIECAKNLILAGPGAVTIYDDGLAEIKDVGVNFFLHEDDVGTPRATAVALRLAELNKMVTLKVHTGDLTEEVVARHNVVVFTHATRSELIRWNNFCRAQSPAIGFIACDTPGVFGYAFTDFGPQFTTHDATGENPITRIITDISSDEDGLVTLLGPDDDGKMHELPDSDHDGWVEISEVEGMINLDDPSQSINTMGPYRIKFANKKVYRNGKQVEVFDPYRFKLVGGTARFSPYLGGGMFTQSKQPFTTAFRSFEEGLTSPVYPGEYGLMFTDGAKFGRAEQLHIVLNGLFQFQEKHGHAPRVYNDEDADKVLEYAKAGPPALEGVETFAVEELDEILTKHLAQVAAIELQPLAAFFGGVIAQEVVKFTGKFTPLKQWMHLDFVEVLPESIPTDNEPQNSRYDNIIQLFGAAFKEKLGNSKTFLVGCGALGCEYLKNFAMVGLACGDEGLVTVTDNDRIEVSNLNRQFLFREHNVGQPKSVAATQAVRNMNASLKVKTLEQLVAPTTENVFNDEFWANLDFVTNALDNVKARLYVDSKCVFYKKALLESGTLGTKCNVQVVLPYKTASYADGPKDAVDDNIPMCTLRNFPSLIEHCIEWARAQFEDLFVVPFGDVSKFAADAAAYVDTVRKATLDHPNPKQGASAISHELERVRALHKLVTREQIDFDACMEMANDLFCSLFRDRILQLIHNFPEDHLTKTGEKFWSGAKRFPQAATELNFEDFPYHLDFIRSVANLYAVNFGLQPLPETETVPPHSYLRAPSTFAEFAVAHPLPEWVPSTETIAENDEELKKIQEDKAANSSNEAEELASLLSSLESLSPEVLANCGNFVPADFEKDNDANFHIDFIAAAANMRAWNYRIKPVSRHKCKMIAGKIIPAIATTTASVTGLAMIELLKIVQDKKLDQFKDSSNSLGLNMYLLQEPAEPEKAKDEYDMIEMSEVKCKPAGFTKWDSTLVHVDRNITMAAFLDTLHENTGLTCNLLFHAAAELGDADPKYQPVRGFMLFDRNAFTPKLKALYEEKLETPLIDWIDERYHGLVDCTRPYVEFQTSCSDDDDVIYKIPTVLCRFQ
ncbi:ubiquitin activating enzyme, E1 family [Thraustotheca clavata]|uniref:E1 ubiquitin-activating enzyme n=1 Tax=Thraustotheca clavata TaxID=74557 RepID=A0A1V9Z431_9STRA|nr:ubiquitin activating enzyme, E1 family [Thraustotheca clavata]